MRKLRRWIIGGLLLLVLLAAFPYIAARQPFRDVMLRAVLPEVNGTATAGGASLGWLSPVEFRDIEIRSPDAAPVVTVPTFRGDRPLWRYLVSPSELGNFRIERPRLRVIVTEYGSNIRQVFAVKSDEPQRPIRLPDLSLGVEIVDASLSFRGRGALQPWSIEGFNLAAAVRPSTATESGLTELAVGPGTVFDHTPIVPQMCNDLLQYIAPVLAEATDVSGEFSIELDDWRLPLSDLPQGEGSGRLVIHSIDAGPGPLVRRLAALLSLPPSVRLADHSTVRFTMADGRVHHRELEFGVRNLTVRTSGSVGLDQSLDLVAEVPLPAGRLGNTRLPDFLTGQAIKLPIRGTLSQPEIDPLALGTSNAPLLLETLEEWLRQRPPGEEGPLERLLDPNRPRETPLLDWLRQRRPDRDRR